ncbi:hypothetical protein CCC_01930 [Paramagnetospirillum magnetotacticum MS-1]|uniref:Uncharacterized protein n=1 Tax=Paramagnetospirillum magnetotacticum MS-1 TaxID=272627 RepID=A0A0C2U5F0_PARME|nr:hypothetical protein [Paramagnetospirillum magnetotacticum]KIL96667.1 hypothetical protein CCC_01930 [Paramagnetospirillum magnetotacticum MS-1]
MKWTWSIGMCTALLLVSASAWAAGGYWAGIAGEVCTEVTKVETFAKAGKIEDAKAAFHTAYFGTFEEKKMEIAERSNFGISHTADVEEMFNNLRKAASKPGTGDVSALAETLRRELRQDGKALDAAKVDPDGNEGKK